MNKIMRWQVIGVGLALCGALAVGCSDGRRKYDVSTLDFNRPLSGVQYPNALGYSFQLFQPLLGVGSHLSFQEVRLRLDGQEWVQSITDEEGFVEAIIPDETQTVDIFACGGSACQGWFDLPRADYLLGVRDSSPRQTMPQVYRETPLSDTEEYVINFTEPLPEDLYLNFVTANYGYSQRALAGSSSVAVHFSKSEIFRSTEFTLVGSTEAFHRNREGRKALNIEAMKLHGVGKLGSKLGRTVKLQPIEWQELQLSGSPGNRWIQDNPEIGFKLVAAGSSAPHWRNSNIRLQRKLKWEDMGSIVRIPGFIEDWSSMSLDVYYLGEEDSSQETVRLEAIARQEYVVPPWAIALPWVLRPRLENFRETTDEIYLGTRPPDANFSVVQLVPKVSGFTGLTLYLPKEHSSISRELLKQAFLRGASSRSVSIRTIADYHLKDISVLEPEGGIFQRPFQED